MITYDHAKFVESLETKAKRDINRNSEVRDLGNDAAVFIKSGIDEYAMYNPDTKEEREAIQNGNYPFYITIDLYFRGVEIGGDSLGYNYGNHEYYKELCKEMIDGLDIDGQKQTYIKSLQVKIELLSK